MHRESRDDHHYTARRSSSIYSGRGFIYFGASRSLMVRSATLPILHSRTTEIMFGASGYKSRRERQCNLSRALRVWLMCARAPSIALMFYARRADGKLLIFLFARVCTGLEAVRAKY